MVSGGDRVPLRMLKSRVRSGVSVREGHDNSRSSVPSRVDTDRDCRSGKDGDGNIYQWGNLRGNGLNLYSRRRTTL